MATYFHVNSSEIQAGDGGSSTLQTLYLMNPTYDYSSNNTLFLNPVNLSHAPPPSNDHHNHPLVGIPLPVAQPSHDHQHQDNITGSVHYDLCSSSVDQNRILSQISNIQNQMTSLAAPPPPLGLLRPVASVPSRQQGLSLSLNSSQQVAAYNRPPPINNLNHDIDVDHDDKARSGQVTLVSTAHDYLTRASESSPSSVSVVSSNGFNNSSVQSAILGSKYLKAAQELLDEVVKVENLIIKNTHHDDSAEEADNNHQEPNGTGAESSTDNFLFQLTTAQRQELQIKKAKLVNMLDEVEQRYKQYHQQMKIVVSAFEQAAGLGSAKSYTALALRTISKQFRCLKDAISAQMKATTKKLGEDDCLGAKGEGSRLRYVDLQLRQQRAFQQLGMVQHHAWRPQRGLPERAVTVLRAWLFEHFLHPYPKDADKQQLAKQTGLSRGQVSNWFINARVRLWKPMVEEMYMEEVKEQPQGRNGNPENNNTSSKLTDDDESKESSPQLMEQIKALQAKAAEKCPAQHMIASPTHHHHHHELSNVNSTLSTGITFQQQTGFDIIGPSDLHHHHHHHLEGFVQRRQKKPRNINNASSISGSGYGMFSMGAEIGRFNNNLPDHQQQQIAAASTFHGLSSHNGVSLTLGLPIPPLAQHSSHSTTGAAYESIHDIQNRKRFAAQLLPDFVTS